MNEITDQKPSFSAVLVGLGRIGMGYDLDLPEVSHVLTHFRALRKHKDFSLIAGVDPDVNFRERFASETDLPTYNSIETCLGHHQPDVVVIASPTLSHFDVMESVLANSRPSAILCEKPLAYSLSESRDMISACEKAGVSLFVNYVRRADPGVYEVRERIRSGRIQGPIKAIVWYTKGMKHNGAHFADLVTYWLGPIRAGRLIVPGRAVGEHDAEPDFLLECELGTAIFCAANEECYSLYTLEMVAANGRLRFEQGGEIFWQGVEADKDVAGYIRLSRNAQSIAGDMHRYQLNVINELARALRGDPHSLCSGTQALASQEWLERLYRERDLMREKNG